MSIRSIHEIALEAVVLKHEARIKKLEQDSHPPVDIAEVVRKVLREEGLIK